MGTTRADFGNGVNVRSAPNQSSALVATVLVGTRVEILEIVAGEAIYGETRWYHIRTGAISGYLYFRLVTPD
jgi:hypothetical protein